MISTPTSSSDQAWSVVAARDPSRRALAAHENGRHLGQVQGAHDCALGDQVSDLLGARLANQKREQSRRVEHVAGCRPRRSSSGERNPPGPASPISDRAAPLRVSTRSTPASSVIATSSPGLRPSRRRYSAGRTRRPFSSRRAVPRERGMWDPATPSHLAGQCGTDRERLPGSVCADRSATNARG